MGGHKVANYVAFELRARAKCDLTLVTYPIHPSDHPSIDRSLE